MKNFFFGVLLGFVIELVIGFGIYNLIAHFSRTYIDSAPFLAEYPIIASVLIGVYIFWAKKSYKITLGIFTGIILSIVVLSFSLAGA